MLASKSALFVSSTILALPLLPTAVRAEADPSAVAKGTVIEEIVVTAQKRQEGAQKVGMSITAVSGDELVAKAVTDANELGKIVPGFVYTQAPRGTPIYSLRGIGFDDSSLGASAAVALYLDEVPLNYSVMSRYTVFDLQQVEVLKGPQGILFGQNSTGGAINFIAAKPTDSFEAGVDGSFGRFNTMELRGYVGGPVSDSLKVRVAAMGVTADGWQTSYTRDDELGDRKVFSGRMIAEWQASQALAVTLNVNGWIDKSHTQAAQLLDSFPSIAPTTVPAFDAYPRSPENPRAADWDASCVVADYNGEAVCPERDDSFIQTSLRADYAFSDTVKLTSISAYSKYKQDFGQDVDGTDIDNFTFHNLGSIRSFSQELRLAGESGRIKWIVGGNYVKDKTKDTTYYFFQNNSVQAGFLGIHEAYSTANQPIEDYAFFGNVDWLATDTITLHGGLRYTQDKRSYTGCTGDTGEGTSATAYTIILNLIYGSDPAHTVLPGGCTTSAGGVPGIVHNSLKEDNISWRLGADWQASPGVLVYGNVSRGYKSGSFPAVNTADAFQLNGVIQESVTAFEAGIKTTLLERRAQINAAAFYYDYKDKQLRGRLLDPFGVFGVLDALLNIPKSRVYGGELSAKFLPVTGLNVDLSLTYTKTKVTRDFFAYDPVGNLFNYKGQPFPHTPKLGAFASADYTFPISSSLSAFVGASLIYQDKSTSLFADSELVGAVQVSPVLRPGVLVDPDTFKVDSYTTVDARIGVQSADEKWRAWIWGKNIFNEYYWNNATQSLDSLYRLAGMPATYGVSFSVRF